MRSGDRQYGFPQTLYSDTGANLSALSGVPEASIAYATDTDLLGVHDGTNWIYVQPYDVTLAGIAALADAAGVLTNDGAGNLSWAVDAGGDIIEGGAGGIVGRVAEFVTDDKHIQAANLIAPANLLTLVAGGAYSLTVPESLTVAGRNVANTFTVGQKINVNSTTALVVEQDGVKDDVLVVDTTNATTTLQITDALTGGIGFPLILAHKIVGTPNIASGTGILFNSMATNGTQVSLGKLEFKWDDSGVSAASPIGRFNVWLNFGGTWNNPLSIDKAGVSRFSGFGLFTKDSTTLGSAGALGVTPSSFVAGHGSEIHFIPQYGYAPFQVIRMTVTSGAGGGIGDLIFGVKISTGSTIVTETMRLTSSGAFTKTGVADVQQFAVTGYSTQAVATPIAQITRNDAAAGVSAMLGLTALGSGAAGDGGSIPLAGKSSTTATTAMGLIDWRWIDATHASRTAALRLYAYDTAARLGLEIQASGTAPMIGFFGGTTAIQQVLSAYTSDGEGAAYTGIDNLQVGTVYATVADLNQLRVAYETLRASYDDLRTKLQTSTLVA